MLINFTIEMDRYWKFRYHHLLLSHLIRAWFKTQIQETQGFHTSIICPIDPFPTKQHKHIHLLKDLKYLFKKKKKKKKLLVNSQSCQCFVSSHHCLFFYLYYHANAQYCHRTWGSQSKRQAYMTLWHPACF